MQNDHIDTRVNIFNDVAEFYDEYRLETPSIVAEILINLSGKKTLDRVVDLGAGTGLSTTLWIEKAKEVIGIEPNNEMRDQAIKRLHKLSGTTDNIHFREGDSSRTGLPDGCVDIVTCSEALHWMEPIATFNEVDRILHPNGIFAAFGHLGCPTIHPQLETKYNDVEKQAHKIRKERNLWKDVKTWPLPQQLDYMRNSGIFSFVKEVHFHSQKLGNAEQFIGWTLSTGIIRGVLKGGISESEIGLTDLHHEANRIIGKNPIPWYVSYHMIIGIKKD